MMGRMLWPENKGEEKAEEFADNPKDGGQFGDQVKNRIDRFHESDRRFFRGVIWFVVNGLLFLAVSIFRGLA